MTAVVLDTRAVEVLADRTADPIAARHLRDLFAWAARRNMPVRVPTAVLAEAYRGTGADAGVDRVLNSGVGTITVGRAMARMAGRLRHRDGLDSCHTVDALVVATAIRLGGGIISTGDPDDIRSLARDHPNVAVAPLRL
ncbi:MAG TPA: PIN domain-containing protein [Acidimicrobiales bacterium]|nr:PIN domain-containing protein [Acidimicrobiales bacterium]